MLTAAGGGPSRNARLRVEGFGRYCFTIGYETPVQSWLKVDTLIPENVTL
jgi:hypothetical protein